MPHVFRIIFTYLVSVALVGASSAAEADAVRSPHDFNRTIQPFLQTYCLRCHDAAKQEGEFRLDTLARDFNDQLIAQKWDEVITRINAGEMPPKDQAQPTPAETGKIVSWLSGRIQEGEAARMAARGPVAHYRLSRDEYAATVYDLLGVRFDVNAPGAFNEDPRWRGYEKIGSMLSLAPSHVESYFKAAEAILKSAYLEKPVKSTVVRGDANKGREQWLIDNKVDGRVRWCLHPKRTVGVQIKQPGMYRVRVQLSGLQPPGGRLPHLTIKQLGFDEDILAPEDAPIVLELEGYLTTGVSFLNDFPVPKWEKHTESGFSQSTFISTRDTRYQPPWSYKLIDDDGQAIHPLLLIDWYEVEGPLANDDEAKRRARFMPVAFDDPAEVRGALHRFAERAWRRPPTETEVDRYMKVVESERAAGENAKAAQLSAMVGIMTSKNFYYLEEGSAKEHRERINDWELASRLSYFLWGTMPDEELFAAARAGTLHEPETLRAQLARMTADPKIKQFLEAFPRQWLQLYRVGQFPPDATLYPDYDAWLERSMLLETTGFFAEVFKQNLPIREFLASDWTMLNTRLAQHYGLPQPPLSGIQRIALGPNDHRGGLLTQGAILSLSSDGTRHRPVHRGVWLSEAVFGTTPPSPPPNVEPLEPTPLNQPKATIRQQLEAHATHAVCSSCHRHIDPLGFAFDNFDAIGRWRIEEKISTGKGDDPPVNAAGQLADGRGFAGPDEFKQLLVEDVDRFAEALVEQLAVFALRRVMTVDDSESIQAIAHESNADDYRLKIMLDKLVTSEFFQKR